MRNSDGVRPAQLADAAMLAGAAITAVGVVLPWVEYRVFLERASVSGIETNPGRLAIAAAVFASLLALVARSTADSGVRRACCAVCLLPAASIVFLAAFNLQDVDAIDAASPVAVAEIGAGLWVTLAGGFLLVLGAAVALAAGAGTAPQAGEGPPAPFWFPGSVPPGDHR